MTKLIDHSIVENCPHPLILFYRNNRLLFGWLVYLYYMFHFAVSLSLTGRKSLPRETPQKTPIEETFTIPSLEQNERGDDSD